MKFISRDTDYAVRALVFMADELGKKKKHLVTVDEIVKRLRLPQKFSRRILQVLAKKGILKSYKGKEGGFSFSKKPDKIKFTDVIKVFQGNFDITNCFLKGDTCPNVKKCALRKKLKAISRMVERELAKITLALLKR